MTTVAMTEKELKGTRIIGASTEGTYHIIKPDLVAKVYNNPLLISGCSDASKRQGQVAHSTLPLGELYVDRELKGTLLRRYPGAIDARNIRLFPLSVRISYLRQLIRNVKELTDNYIYPTSIGNGHNSKLLTVNKPFFSPVSKDGVHIFGLDGPTTIYASKKEDMLRSTCIERLLQLICDLLVDIDSYELYSRAEGESTMQEIDYVIQRLKAIGMSTSMAEAIALQKATDFEQLTSITDFVGKGYQMHRMH